MIARKTGTLVLLGMLCGGISGCGTQLDPRLAPNASLRASCTVNGLTYSDQNIKAILVSTEQRRLAGSTKEEEYQTAEDDCIKRGFSGDNLVQCFQCNNACIDQVFSLF